MLWVGYIWVSKLLIRIRQNYALWLMISMFQWIIFSRFVVDFIEESYPTLGIDEDEEKLGRDSYPVCSILKLLVYSKCNHIESAEVIADMVKYHDIYRFVCDGFKPSARTIQRYRKKYGKYFNILIQKTLEKAKEEGFTEFEHISIDGTIVKANNSTQNMISKKETSLLIQYYKGMDLDLDKIEELNRPAKKIFENDKMSVDDKLELLYDIETQFTLTGHDKIPLNDIESRYNERKERKFHNWL